MVIPKIKNLQTVPAEVIREDIKHIHVKTQEELDEENQLKKLLKKLS